MRYVLFYTTNDYEEDKVYVRREEYTDFEEMMENFTLLSECKESVLVIEPDTKKVVCHYQSEGKVLFNKVLLDGTISVKNFE